LSVSPRQQFVAPVDLVVSDTAKNIGQPSLRINAVELGRFDQYVGNGRRLSSTLRSGEQPIFAPESYASHATFGGIDVIAEATIIEIRGKRTPQTALRDALFLAKMSVYRKGGVIA
jgi:hypothetical protein